MRRGIFCLVPALTLGSTAAIPLEASASCDVIGKWGIYDTRVEAGEFKAANSWRHYFCSKKFQDSTSARNFGLSLDLPIPDLPIGLGFDAGSSDYSSWQDEYCSDEVSESVLENTQILVTQTINPHLAKAIAACVSLPGYHAWIETTSDPKTFGFNSIWRGGGKVTLESFNLGSGVNCNPAPRRGQRDDGQGFSTTCTRSDNSEVLVVWGANQPTIWDTPRNLTKIEQPKPLPTPTEIVRRASKFNSSKNIAVASLAAYGDDFIHNAPPYHAQPNEVEYVQEVGRSYSYDLAIELAALEPRPLNISVNGTQKFLNVLGVVTGDWHTRSARWFSVGRIDIKRGKNTITISRGDVFPHITAIRLTPIPSP